MLVGVIGFGIKSILVDGIVNYMMGVNLCKMIYLDLFLYSLKKKIRMIVM